MTQFLQAARSLPRRLGHELRGQGRASRLATLGLLAVLIALSGFALWGSLATYQVGVAVKQASELSDALDDARYAVVLEEALERQYRMEPGVEIRLHHQETAAALDAVLNRVSMMAPPADRLMIDDILTRHVQYLAAIDRMFAAVDAGDTARVEAIDKGETDPAFDAVETRVDKAAKAHRIDAAEHLQALAAIQTSVVVSTPVVFVLGVGLVIFFWRTLRRYQRRVEEQGHSVLITRCRGRAADRS